MWTLIFASFVYLYICFFLKIMSKNGRVCSRVTESMVILCRFVFFFCFSFPLCLLVHLICLLDWLLSVSEFSLIACFFQFVAPENDDNFLFPMSILGAKVKVILPRFRLRPSLSSFITRLGPRC